MPARNGHLERRIIELLTATDQTFKEIISTLRSENLSASVGIIRRINRNNRYRQPRYDSKLTPNQREALVRELRGCTDARPNLSLLAKRYGVCHGSVWYWWDKLNRIEFGPSSSGSTSGGQRRSQASNGCGIGDELRTVGRVNVITGQGGQMALPIVMFVKRRGAVASMVATAVTTTTTTNTTTTTGAPTGQGELVLEVENIEKI